MTPSRRWSLVAVAVALVVGGPLLARARPVDAPDLSAAQTLALVRAADHGFAGTVQLNGSLDLPVTSHFTDVGALLGGHTTLRVWWRDPDHWRVDKLLPTGETDLVHTGALTTQWRYEGARVVRSVDPDVRLPRTADLLPPALAVRALDGVDPDTVSRLPARRVAGTATVGLRIGRSSPQSSIARVDLWADPGTGTVLRLDVYAEGDRDASFSTWFSDYSASTPDRAATSFTPPVGADVSFDEVLDIADAANQYAPFEPPDAVAGLSRSPTPQGAVGVYGSGLTRILVVPLRGRDAGTLEDQLRRSPGVVETDLGMSLYAGPLGVLVADEGEGSWLVVGAVTQDTLVTAARDLVTGARFR
jgi:hypothetical protein